MNNNTKFCQYNRTSLNIPDLTLTLIVVLLIACGLITIYSVTLHYGWEKTFSTGVSFFKNHLIRILIGLATLLFITYLPHSIFRKFMTCKLVFKKLTLSDISLVISILILIVTLITGKKAASARRWILFFQPAEFIKIFVVIWLCSFLTRLHDVNKECFVKNNSIKVFLTPLFTIGIITLLILLQPAIGTSAIIAVSSLIIMIVGGYKIRYLMTAGIFISIIFLITIITVPYAQKRLKEFISTSYHQQQALIAIGSGGITGKGLGEGKQKLHFLPKAHTDFIFSSFAEELGFLGSLGLFALFFLLFNRAVKITFYMKEYCDKILTIGLITLISTYFFTHLLVNLALIPTTGQPLPFISYGGSALVSNLLSVGIILNLSRQSLKEPLNIRNLNLNRKYLVP
ncbi:MAG: FtsW/RodA/SpoVE family cell cycle protein [candidate division WOR-3 bacterium]|nr:FtsW/RodA/SpoVE family cell cycle protein [candidate division WOR-3 bacterium]